MLGATPGLMVWLSAAGPVSEKDPHRRSGPFDTGDDPATAGALAAHGYLMLGLVVLAAVPAATLVLLGGLGQRPPRCRVGGTRPSASCGPSGSSACSPRGWCRWPSTCSASTQVRVWFAARYAPQDLQLPVAAGFIAVGLLASWWAEAIRRRPTERRP